MPRTRFLTLEDLLEQLFDKYSDDDENRLTGEIVTMFPEITEYSDEEKGNDKIIIMTSIILCFVILPLYLNFTKKKSEPTKSSVNKPKSKNGDIQLQDGLISSALKKHSRQKVDILQLNLQTIEYYVSSIATTILFIAAMFVLLVYIAVVLKHNTLDVQF